MSPSIAVAVLSATVSVTVPALPFATATVLSPSDDAPPPAVSAIASLPPAAAKPVESAVSSPTECSALPSPVCPRLIGSHSNTAFSRELKPQALVHTNSICAVPLAPATGTARTLSCSISTLAIKLLSTAATDQLPGALSTVANESVNASPTVPSALSSPALNCGGPCTTIATRVCPWPPCPLIVSTASYTPGVSYRTSTLVRSSKVWPASLKVSRNVYTKHYYFTYLLMKTPLEASR